eukprot:249724_1
MVQAPWPDTSVANEFMPYIVCPRAGGRMHGGDMFVYEPLPPSYLAIVHPDINDLESNPALRDLLDILASKYGNSSSYPGMTGTWAMNTFMEKTWYYYQHGVDMSNPKDLMELGISFSQLFKSSQDGEYGCFYGGGARDTSFLRWEEGSLLKFFETEKELEDYTKESKYGSTGYNLENTAERASRPVGAAIVFDSTGGDNGLEWHYTFRFNSSDVPTTEIQVDKFTRNHWSLYQETIYNYLDWSGFVQLQNWIDEGIMQYILETTYEGQELEDKMDRFEFYTTQYDKGVFQFATAEYAKGDYWDAVGSQFPFFCFIMFCYPIITVLSILVQEKQTKIKEGMKMMGATTSAYWTSWIIWFFIEFTLMTLLVTVLGFGGSVFLYSGFGVIFLWFWLFCLSSATFAMLISTLFDNPKTASLCGLIVYFAVLIGGQFAGTLNESQKGALCLLGPTCFVAAIPTIQQYESFSVGVNWDNINDTYNEFKFSTCLIMMAVDVFIYLALTLYLDQVWPSRYGQKQRPWFCFMPSYWSKCFGCGGAKESELYKNAMKRRMSSVIDTETYEAVKEDKGEPMIALRELTKTFSAFGVTESSRKQVRAVQQVSLDMYQGEVFALLGHNGAGKTTTIGMMTGLLEITGGNAWILNNNVADPSAMSDIRKHLGVCPQHDVLWDKLTLKEHLWLFARLKGVPERAVKAEVDKILKDTGLVVNNDAFPIQMSGGEKRKLSLAIALIGGSQIVFLDEPTSGMDPQSRRVTWNLIRKEKKNRCIILTTHFMDEADLLGDRIAIMGSGKVKCCGSGMYLKHLYGVGYTFTVSLTAEDDTSDLIDTLKAKVDKFVYDTVKDSQEVSLAGSELTYRLPFEQAGTFATLFDILDANKEELKIKSYGISVTTLEEVFLKIGHDEDESFIDEDNEPQDHQAPQSDEEERKEPLQQKEEQHIRMNAADRKAAKAEFAPTAQISTFALQDRNSFQIFWIHVYAVLYKRFWWSIRDFKALVCALFCPVILSSMALGLMTIQIATTQPRIDLTTAEWHTHPEDVSIPMARNIASMPDSSVTYYPIEENFYNANSTLEGAYTLSVEDTIGEMVPEDVEVDPAATFVIQWMNFSIPGVQNVSYQRPAYPNITHPFQDHLFEQQKHNDPVYNAFLFYPYSMTENNRHRVMFGVNGSAYHSVPITLNIWNNWVLADIMEDDYPQDAKDPVIKISSHPLPVTVQQDLISSSISGFMAALYLVIAFSFIPAGAIYFMVNEKSNLTKHQQLVSGISVTAYWFSNYIADFCVGLPASLLVFCSIYVFDAKAFQDEAAGPFLVTLLMFLFSCLPFTYLLSFLFNSPSKAQLATILLYILLGMILGLVSFILWMIPTTRETNEDLKPLYRVFPVYLMCETLLNISMKDLLFPLDDIWHWDVVSRNYVLMAIEGVGYFALVLVLEYLGTFPILLAKIGLVTNRPNTEEESSLDSDVLAEKKRIYDGLVTDPDTGKITIDADKLTDTVILNNLRKVYDPAGSSRAIPCFSRVPDHLKVEAVTSLNFGVKQSEVFGFLGVNGAGKTTTLATLTGERYPSSGNAFVAGYPISNQLQCRRYVGYCPQFDAIFDLLTGSEHLKFYAMIKGLTTRAADEQVKVLLSALTLNKYKGRTAGTYSGGNKRKLSVAVSMIGNPPVIFLDEPSTGMDPVSRRHMWEFISTTMAGRCVILTTHSMEECEALCKRLGIMVNGQLRCIGTPQNLKAKFGKGYQLDMTLHKDVVDADEKECQDVVDQLEKVLTEKFGVVTLIERNASRVSYEVIKSETQNNKLGAMFNVLENMKQEKFKNVLSAYALSQTSLEQIFIRMAKQGEKEREMLKQGNSGQAQAEFHD